MHAANAVIKAPCRVVAPIEGDHGMMGTKREGHVAVPFVCGIK